MMYVYLDWSYSGDLAVNGAAESRCPAPLSIDDGQQESALFVFSNSFREAVAKGVKKTLYVSLHSPYY